MPFLVGQPYVSVYTEYVRFEWDFGKAATNVGKHRISFELAITAFDDPYALIAPDPKHSVRERREWLIGEADRGAVVVVFTRRHRGRVCRVISARRASKRERRMYEEAKRISV